MEINVICFTQKGLKVSNDIKKYFVEYKISVAKGFGEDKASLQQWTEQGFKSADALVFVGSTGIAVRSIAKHLQSKLSDPAVIVLDDNANFCIPLLSGHTGGANALAVKISEALNATCILTTATDVNGVFAFDSFASSNQMHLQNPKEVKQIAARMLKGNTIKVKSDFTVIGADDYNLQLTNDEDYDVKIGIYNETSGKLGLVPKIVHIGIGCKKDVGFLQISECFEGFLAQNGIHPMSVSAIHSIDIKREETGIIMIAKGLHIPFTTFCAEELSQVEGDFHSSDFVLQTVGVDNVCQRSALLGSKGKLLTDRFCKNGVTMAAAVEELEINLRGNNE